MPAAIDWTPEFTSGVIQGIESGLTLRQVAEKHEISAAAIIRQVQANEDFAKQYARVIELRTDADFEGLIDLVDESPQETQYGVDSAWVNWQRMRVDTRKWILSKRCPKKYGDKTQLTGADGESAVQLVVKHIASDGESAE